MQCTTSINVHMIHHEEDVESCNAINTMEETKDRSVAKILHSVKKTYQLHSKPRKNYKEDNTDKDQDKNEDEDNVDKEDNDNNKDKDKDNNKDNNEDKDDNEDKDNN